MVTDRHGKKRMNKLLSFGSTDLPWRRMYASRSSRPPKTRKKLIEIPRTRFQLQIKRIFPLLPFVLPLQRTGKVGIYLHYRPQSHTWGARHNDAQSQTLKMMHSQMISLTTCCTISSRRLSHVTAKRNEQIKPR